MSIAPSEISNAAKSLQPTVLKLSSQWLVLAKPAGWLTIPGRPAPMEAGPMASTATATKEDQILSEWAAREHGPVWTVHRLDRETSGVVLFARSAESHRQANEWFRKRLVKKTYYC